MARSCACGTLAAFRCAECLSVTYCSAGCQREDWRAWHRFECQAVARAWSGHVEGKRAARDRPELPKAKRPSLPPEKERGEEAPTRTFHELISGLSRLPDDLLADALASASASVRAYLSAPPEGRNLPKSHAELNERLRADDSDELRRTVLARLHGPEAVARNAFMRANSLGALPGTAEAILAWSRCGYPGQLRLTKIAPARAVLGDRSDTVPRAIACAPGRGPVFLLLLNGVEATPRAALSERRVIYWESMLGERVERPSTVHCFEVVGRQLRVVVSFVRPGVTEEFLRTFVAALAVHWEYDGSMRFLWQRHVSQRSNMPISASASPVHLGLAYLTRFPGGIEEETAPQPAMTGRVVLPEYDWLVVELWNVAGPEPEVAYARKMKVPVPTSERARRLTVYTDDGGVTLVTRLGTGGKLGALFRVARGEGGGYRARWCSIDPFGGAVRYEDTAVISGNLIAVATGATPVPSTSEMVRLLPLGADSWIWSAAPVQPAPQTPDPRRLPPVEGWVEEAFRRPINAGWSVAASRMVCPRVGFSSVELLLFASPRAVPVARIAVSLGRAWLTFLDAAGRQFVTEDIGVDPRGDIITETFDGESFVLCTVNGEMAEWRALPDYALSL